MNDLQAICPDHGRVTFRWHEQNLAWWCPHRTAARTGCDYFIPEGDAQALPRWWCPGAVAGL